MNGCISFEISSTVWYYTLFRVMVNHGGHAGV